MKKKAILFDRDGVLVSDPPDKRVDTLEKVKIFPEAIDALGQIAKLNYQCFIITNQAGIAEGLITEEEFFAINERMYELLSPSGISFEKLYFSPDAPDSDSPRRKPNTGMLDELLNEYEIDVANSFMIGDRDSDIEFGKRGGLKTVLIERKDGLSFEHENKSKPDYVVGDLSEFAKIVAQSE